MTSSFVTSRQAFEATKAVLSGVKRAQTCVGGLVGASSRALQTIGNDVVDFTNASGYLLKRSYHAGLVNEQKTLGQLRRRFRTIANPSLEQNPQVLTLANNAGTYFYRNPSRVPNPNPSPWSRLLVAITNTRNNKVQINKIREFKKTFWPPQEPGALAAKKWIEALQNIAKGSVEKSRVQT